MQTHVHTHILGFDLDARVAAMDLPVAVAMQHLIDQAWNGF